MIQTNLISNKDIQKIFLKSKKSKVLKPFDEKIINFLNLFRENLVKLNKTNNIIDIYALIFYLRKTNILKIKSEYNYLDYSVGIGIIFHITPSNMPINFFYSYLFGLLSGSINIVRLPTKNFIQIQVIIKAFEKTIKNKKFNFIKNMTYFVRYNKESEFTKIISNFCDLRVIWGGDKTVEDIRKYNLNVMSRDITFPDRHSFSLINNQKFNKLNDSQIKNLAKNFFTDGFFVDQNACSSPHIIFWVGKDNKTKIKKFWKYVHEIKITNYDLPQKGFLEKFLLYSEDTIENKINAPNNNHIMNFNLKKLPLDISHLRGKWGYFYEYNLKKIELISNLISKKTQTVTYFGFESKFLFDIFFKNNVRGVDRIVPIGRAHLMKHIWDGYDFIGQFSRRVNIE